MWFPRLAKSLHKCFRTQFLFGAKIKSTYKNVLGKNKFFGPECKTRVSASKSTFGSKAKMNWFPPTFFQLFINFLVVCHFLCTTYTALRNRYGIIFGLYSILVLFSFDVYLGYIFQANAYILRVHKITPKLWKWFQR